MSGDVGELKRRIQGALGFNFAMYNAEIFEGQTSVGYDNLLTISQNKTNRELQKIVDVAKQEIYDSVIPSTPLINLGDYVLVNKEILQKWLGGVEQK